MYTAEALYKKFLKYVGHPEGMLTIEKIAQKMAVKWDVPLEQARDQVTDTYKAVLQEFLSLGTLRLPWGVTTVPSSRLSAKILEKFKCSNSTFHLPPSMLKDPPFTYFKPITITSLIAMEVEQELELEGITKKDLQACIFGAN